jgi:hypothetical protein
MAKQWRPVRLEAGLVEDLECEIERLMESYTKGVPIAVEPNLAANPQYRGISMSDFVRRLLTVYQRERRRKEASAKRKRRKQP